MKIKQCTRIFLAVLAVQAIMGCAPAPSGDSTSPTVVSSSPAQGDGGVSIASLINATFSEEMDPASITAANITVAAGATGIAGTVTYDSPTRTAVFASSELLATDSEYTLTVTTGTEDSSGNPMANAWVLTFTTASTSAGPLPVNLRTSASFAILSKTGVSTVPLSDITGDVGVSPAAETYLTGFSQTDATGYATSPQVSGFLYAADMAPPTPAKMTAAVSDMETAYDDAAGRVTPNFTNLGAGEIGGLTLAPGLYAWSTALMVSTDLTISGGANDVWIFQVAGNLSVANGVSVILAGAAQARNIFWQIGSSANLGTTSHFEGTILSMTAILMGTGSSMNGRALSQTAISLGQATVTIPAN